MNKKLFCIILACVVTICMIVSVATAVRAWLLMGTLSSGMVLMTVLTVFCTCVIWSGVRKM